jgi:hypothetical protein
MVGNGALGTYVVELGSADRFADFLAGLAGQPSAEIERLADSVRTAAAMASDGAE